VPNNTVILEVDDELVIDCPVAHAYTFYHEGDCLNFIKLNDNVKSSYCVPFGFIATQSARDFLGFYFVDHCKNNSQNEVRTVHRLGYISVLVKSSCIF